MKLSLMIACSASALCIALSGCAHYYGQQSSERSASAGSAVRTAGLRAERGMTRQQVFDQLDTNRDGMISRSEAEASPDLVAIFMTTDANSDSSLSLVEFALVPISFGDAAPETGALHAQRGMTREQVFDALDTNRDNAISDAEAQANPELAAIFVATDANGDGTLSAVEFAAVPLAFDGGTAVGLTDSVGGGMVSGPSGWRPVQTPSQVNETQPGMMNAMAGGG